MMQGNPVDIDMRIRHPIPLRNKVCNPWHILTIALMDRCSEEMNIWTQLRLMNKTFYDVRGVHLQGTSLLLGMSLSNSYLCCTVWFQYPYSVLTIVLQGGAQHGILFPDLGQPGTLNYHQVSTRSNVLSAHQSGVRRCSNNEDLPRRRVDVFVSKATLLPGLSQWLSSRLR